MNFSYPFFLFPRTTYAQSPKLSVPLTKAFNCLRNPATIKRYRKLCQENGLDFSDVETIHITAGSSTVVSLALVQQIFSVPQAQLLARVHPRRLGERGQDKLWGQRVVTGNLWPLEKCCGKLTWRPNDVIGWGCYFNVDHIFDACDWIVAASPVRPKRSPSSVTGHITVQVYQFHGSHVSTIWDVKPAKMVMRRAKTHWGVIQFDPAIWKLNRSKMISLFYHFNFSGKKTFACTKFLLKVWHFVLILVNKEMQLNMHLGR